MDPAGEVAMSIGALRRGDSSVLDELLERYGTELRAVAFLILRDRAEAEDVASETLLRALRSAQMLHDPEAVRPWLLRIAANQAIDRQRRSVRIRYVHVLPDRASPTIESTVIDRTILLDALQRLPTRTRAAVVLHYYADLPVADVAKAMGTSVNTVKSQLRTALAQLRTALQEDQEPHVRTEVRHA